MNETLLLHIYYRSQYNGFGIFAYDVAYHHSGKKYIHSGHQFILMKFYEAQLDMALIYVPIW